MLASVNEIVIAQADEALSEDQLRQRAYSELLRQRAQQLGLLAADDPAPEQGVMSEAASRAIEALMDRELTGPEPDEASCRRHFDAHARRYAQGERLHLRNILFARL